MAVQGAVEFEYDAFISYVRKDEAWATFLAVELARRDFKVFVDTDRLVAGTEWADQLDEELKRSRHIILLWSQTESDWVTHEKAVFEAERRSTPEVARHVIPVLLEGDYKPLRRYERIDAVRKAAGAYAAGPSALGPEVRRPLLDKLVASLRHRDAARPVPLLVIAPTRAELAATDPHVQVPPQVGETLNQLAVRLGLESREDLLPYYGSEREDWRPFRGEATIGDVLDGVKEDINRRLKQSRLEQFRWEPLDTFWDDPGQISGHLVDGLVVIVVDLLALYQDGLAYKLANDVMPQVRQNRRAVVTVLSPFGLPADALMLRESIRNRAREIFTGVYDPPTIVLTTPSCHPSVGDEMDLRAPLLRRIGAELVPGEPDGSTFTRTRT
ncbi:TIR domain-containing protein [Solirubrobacter pauli]|uniref:TIR domain-containing protein n=1 Tax=Solirubrobacter pauli TaxID=166793 RepID=A0A660L8Y1_9ACTN|nr:toll/interleukin-1 receptor domain-containing protein [Solirubrobacter pauli]RKQ91492.1 TIR domain-containing protein [Solirubrobacter pauli]